MTDTTRAWEDLRVVEPDLRGYFHVLDGEAYGFSGFLDGVAISRDFRQGFAEHHDPGLGTRLRKAVADAARHGNDPNLLRGALRRTPASEQPFDLAPYGSRSRISLGYERARLRLGRAPEGKADQEVVSQEIKQLASLTFQIRRMGDPEIIATLGRLCRFELETYNALWHPHQRERSWLRMAASTYPLAFRTLPEQPNHRAILNRIADGHDPARCLAKAFRVTRAQLKGIGRLTPQAVAKRPASASFFWRLPEAFASTSCIPPEKLPVSSMAWAALAQAYQGAEDGLFPWTAETLWRANWNWHRLGSLFEGKDQLAAMGWDLARLAALTTGAHMPPLSAAAALCWINQGRSPLRLAAMLKRWTLGQMAVLNVTPDRPCWSQAFTRSAWAASGFEPVGEPAHILRFAPAIEGASAASLLRWSPQTLWAFDVSKEGRYRLVSFEADLRDHRVRLRNLTINGPKPPELKQRLLKALKTEGANLAQILAVRATAARQLAGADSLQFAGIPETEAQRRALFTALRRAFSFLGPYETAEEFAQSPKGLKLAALLSR